MCEWVYVCVRMHAGTKDNLGRYSSGAIHLFSKTVSLAEPKATVLSRLAGWQAPGSTSLPPGCERMIGFLCVGLLSYLTSPGLWTI